MSVTQLLTAALALLCLHLPTRTLAQSDASKSLRDTLILATNGNNRVVVPVENVRQPENIPSLNAVVQRLHRDLRTVYDSLIDPKCATTIIYVETPGGGRTLKVNTTPRERSELSFNRETGQIRAQTNQDSVVVELENKRKVFFILDSVKVLPQLAQQDLDALLPALNQEVAAYTAARKRKDFMPYKGSYTAIYQPQRADGKPALRMEMSSHAKDYLSVNVSVGAGLIRDRLVPEIGFGTAVVFNRQRYVGLSTSLHYFFEQQADRKYGMAINTFVTLEYGQTFNKGKWWQKFGVGYLVNRQGDFFGKNTFKASLSLSGKRQFGVNVIPELFVTDNFRTAFPGLRVGIGF